MNMRVVRPIGDVYSAVQISDENMDEIVSHLNLRYGTHSTSWTRFNHNRMIVRLEHGDHTDDIYVIGDWIVFKTGYFEVISVVNFNEEYMEV